MEIYRDEHLEVAKLIISHMEEKGMLTASAIFEKYDQEFEDYLKNSFDDYLEGKSMPPVVNSAHNSYKEFSEAKSHVLQENNLEGREFSDFELIRNMIGLLERDGNHAGVKVAQNALDGFKLAEKLKDDKKHNNRRYRDNQDWSNGGNFKGQSEPYVLNLKDFSNTRTTLFASKGKETKVYSLNASKKRPAA